MKKSLLFILVGVIAIVVVSCENEDTDFPDYDYTTAYFAYQAPIRTLVLGNDENVDVTIDNEHKCRIYGMVGGTRNGVKATIDFVVDESLCDNLYFGDGETAVTPMPASYYTLASNQISVNGINGYVEVQLTDAFFADKKSLENTYVIPLRMTNVTGADSILVGSSPYENPVRTVSSDWDIQPKDYVLYLVKYICPWAGVYLRRGVDVTTANGQTTTNVRHEQYVESDEVFTLTTNSLASVLYPFNEECNLLLTFDDSGNCVVSSDAEGYHATGTGSFVEKGAIKAWGNKDRDVIYLDYTIEHGGVTVATKDTLVARDRGVSGTAEEFSYIYKE